MDRRRDGRGARDVRGVSGIDANQIGARNPGRSVDRVRERKGLVLGAPHEPGRHADLVETCAHVRPERDLERGLRSFPRPRRAEDLLAEMGEVHRVARVVPGPANGLLRTMPSAQHPAETRDTLRSSSKVEVRAKR